MNRSRFKWLLAGGGLALFFVFCCFTIARLLPHNRPEPDSAPLLMAIHNIGQLRTITFQLKDVVHKETSQEPSGWLRGVPGVTAATAMMTRNRVLVTAEGSVDAGLDLTSLKASDIRDEQLPNGSHRLHVTLPPVTIYEPHVKVRVEDVHSGLLWRDNNIVPAAEREAETRFREEAEAGGIRSRAEQNAIDILQRLLLSLGKENVDFSFRRNTA